MPERIGKTAFGASSKRAQDVAVRGEWVYVADGSGGLRVFDRANISNASKAQRLVQAQNSPAGQRTQVRTKDATSVALPSNLPMNPDREQLAINEEMPTSSDR